MDGNNSLLASLYHFSREISPIRTTDLEEDEWMDIDPIEYDIGGSTLWVGRFLWEKGQKSYLFSAIGSSDDPLTKEFKKLIKHERRSWLQNKLITGIPNSRTAVTVHLSVEDEIE